MSIELITVLMFGFFFLLLALGVPLAWNMGGLRHHIRRHHRRL